MKKLFLASYFSFVSDSLLPLLPKKPSELTLAFVPTAADLYPIKPWFYGDKLKLKMMGFKMIEVDLKNKTKAQLMGELEHADVIFVSGGNTYYLLEKAQKSGFLEIARKLVSKGVIYVGSSAGSALACPTIGHVEDLDDINVATLTDFQGLGLIDFLILPHYGNRKYEDRFQRIMAKWKGNDFSIQALTDTQAYVVNGTQVQLVGR